MGGLDNHQLSEVLQGKVPDCALGMVQPWLYGQAGEWDAREQHHAKGTGNPSGWKVGYESAVPWQPGGTSLFWGAPGPAWPIGPGGDCPSLLCTGAGSSRVLGAVWASQYKKDIKLLESFERTLPGMGQQQLLWATCARAGGSILSQYGTGNFTMARATFSSLPEVA